MSALHTEFHNRLARINSGASYTKATVYVGQDGVFTYVPKNKRRGGPAQSLGGAAYTLFFSVSMALGVLCHILERYITFTLAGIPDPSASPDTLMVRAGLTGLAATLVLTHMLGLRNRTLLLPKLLGVAGGMLFFHNAVHLWPQEFEAVFAPPWVAQIISMTEPHSLVWRGISFPF